MKNLTHSLYSLSITAWVGSLWAIGYLAVPVLFYAQTDRQLAGLLAGSMFTKASYLGMICGAYLIGYSFMKSGRTAISQPLFWVIAAMLALTILIQFGIQPVMTGLKAQALPLDVMHSEFSNRFKMLHGLSSIVYLAQSLLGALLVIQSRRQESTV